MQLVPATPTAVQLAIAFIRMPQCFHSIQSKRSQVAKEGP